MQGQDIEAMIYDWLNDKYPDGPVWFDDESQLDNSPPLEIRMIYPFNVIEYNIGNGGWAQFLWNCVGNWRALIATAEAGYELMGAPEQVEALKILRTLCENNEAQCLAALEQEDGSMETFADYTTQSYLSKGNDWEQLFWTEIYEKRLRWLEANEARIRSILDRFDA